MRIMICTTRFAPLTGGMETVSEILACEFHRQGHEVIVATPPAVSPPRDRFPGIEFLVTRPLYQFWSNLRRCDAVLQANVTLPMTLFLLITVGRRLTVVHHTWYVGLEKKRRFRDRLKLIVTRIVRNIAVSHSIAKHLEGTATVVSNPYDNETFAFCVATKRSGDLLFVGRLVSDKGVDLLLRAMLILPMERRLTIVGDGPEHEDLLRQADQFGISDRVHFTGTRSGSALAEVYQSHKVLVIPSRWNEPFGVVGLEALASGCQVVAADRDGLREALGAHATYVDPHDAQSLATSILQASTASNFDWADRMKYLENFHRPKVAARYLKILEAGA